MQVLIGIILLFVVFGAIFFLYEARFFDSFNPIFNGLGSVYGPRDTGTSTVNQSPYYGEVKVQFVSLGAGISQPMVVSLGAALSKDTGITVSGWSLWVDNTSYQIPKVVNLYSPSVPGVPPEDIYIKAGGTINFYSGKNPQGNDQAI